jgi:hypothetical protein
MKSLVLISVLFISIESYAFFGAEAETTKAYKAIEGALAGSILVDDVNVITKDGVDYSELEALATERSKTAARLKGDSEQAAAEYENIRYMDQYNSRSSEVTKNLKRVVSLYGTMCAMSPESCGVAVGHIGNKKAEQTNKTLEEIKIEQSKRDLKEELERVKEKERNIKTLRAINSYPSLLFQKIIGKR